MNSSLNSNPSDLLDFKSHPFYFVHKLSPSLSIQFILPFCAIALDILSLSPQSFFSFRPIKRRSFLFLFGENNALARFFRFVRHQRSAYLWTATTSLSHSFDFSNVYTFTRALAAHLKHSRVSGPKARTSCRANRYFSVKILKIRMYSASRHKYCATKLRYNEK